MPVAVLFGCAGAALGAMDSSANPDAAAMSLMSGTVLGVMCVGLLVSLPITLLLPVIIARVALTDSIGAGLNVGAVIADARRMIANLFVTLLMMIVLQLLAALGILACGIGIAFTSFLAYVMIAHLYGQIAQEVREGIAPQTFPGIAM